MCDWSVGCEVLDGRLGHAWAWGMGHSGRQEKVLDRATEARFRAAPSPDRATMAPFRDTQRRSRDGGSISRGDQPKSREDGIVSRDNLSNCATGR